MMTSTPTIIPGFAPSIYPPTRRRSLRPGPTFTSKAPRMTLARSEPAPPLITPIASRRAVIASFGALFGLSAFAHWERALAQSPTLAPLAKLQEARKKADTIDALIDSAKWDSVRTTLAKDPIFRTRDACNALIEASSQDMQGAIVGLREDAMSSIRLLDTSVYANVFIGEDRQILGTKVDYDVPRIYLAQLKDALDELIELATG